MDDDVNLKRIYGPGTAYGMDELELKVLALVSDGQTNREIAAALELEIASVKKTVTSILRKMARGAPRQPWPRQWPIVQHAG